MIGLAMRFTMIQRLLFLGVILVTIPAPARADESSLTLDAVMRRGRQVLPEDYQTPDERLLARSLEESARLTDVARRIADRQAFDAGRSLGLSAIRVSASQLPAIWSRTAETARLLGLDPARLDLFVTGLPEFSTFSWGYADGRALVVLSSQVHQYLEPLELGFVMAAELSSVAADHNLFRNIGQLVTALQDSTFRVTYGVPDRLIRDVHGWELSNDGFAKIFHLPRMVVAMVGISALTAWIASEATSWLVGSLNKKLFASLSRWAVASKASANRAGLLVTYLALRRQGLARPQALDRAVAVAGRTFVKFVLRDPALAAMVDVQEAIGQARAVVLAMEADKTRTMEERATWYRRFTGWFRDKVRAWLWGTANLDASLKSFQGRGYLAELVELVDYSRSPELIATLDRIEEGSALGAGVTAMRGLEGLYPETDPRLDAAKARLLDEISVTLSADESARLERIFDAGL